MTWAYEINLPFSIRFQGTSYSKFYVCTNSYITFGGPSTAYTNLNQVPYPKLFIDAADNVATNLTVSVASNNVTIYYLGRRYDNTTGVLEWKLTFFGELYERFSLDLISNSLSNAGKGVTSICTASNCYQSFDATIPRVTGFFDCEGGCLDQTTLSCQPTTKQYCGICPTATSCSSCVLNYAFVPTTDNCTLCNSSALMIFNGECFPLNPRLLVNYTSPTVCLKSVVPGQLHRSELHQLLCWLFCLQC
jgi:hypothetical protein